MTTLTQQNGTGYSASTPGDGYLFMCRQEQPVGQGPGIIVTHGHGGNALGNLPYYVKFSPGYFCHLLALEGYRVLAIDDMGAADWGSLDSNNRIDDAIAWLQNPNKGGAKTGKVGLHGWSMGGLAALNWIDNNPAKHAASWLWAPCSDLEWAHAQSAWTAEIDAAYATEGTRIGYNPAAIPQNYRGVGPIKLCHAQDDATIPYSQSQNFVAAVNDPAVTLKTITSGGHTGLFGPVTDLEFVKFFKDNL